MPLCSPIAWEGALRFGQSRYTKAVPAFAKGNRRFVKSLRSGLLNSCDGIGQLLVLGRGKGIALLQGGVDCC